MLLSRFPDSTVNKVGDNQLNTKIGKATAVVQLVSKHSGEIVENDTCRSSFRRRKMRQEFEAIVH